MIIVRLIGRLGNQLFQYAAGRALADRHHAKLFLDTTLMTPEHRSSYALDPFAIQSCLISQEELAKLLEKRKLLFRHRYLIKRVKEPHFHYDPSFRKLRNNAFLWGYWQSERYFSEIEEIIRKEFQQVAPMTSQDKEVCRQMEAATSVSLHVRRGDYVTHPEVIAHHPLCSLEYYRAATEAIAQKTQNPHFFLFSDDPDWVQKNLKLPYPMTLVNHNDGAHGYRDLNLMSHCQHHIIANSSFSWWGAYLNPRSHKIVIASKRWFVDQNKDTKDLLPAGWMTI